MAEKKLRPSPPTDVRIDGVDETAKMATKSTGTVEIRAKIDDPNAKQKVRLVLQLSANKQFSPYSTYKSDLVKQNTRTGITVTGLVRNTLYRGRLYTQDSTGLHSENYTTISFWTNRNPSPPNPTSPEDNTQFTDVDPITFVWEFVDPDGESRQGGYNARYRKIAAPGKPVNAWVYRKANTKDTFFTLFGVFSSNASYEWQVQTKDPQGYWGGWSLTRSFYVTGVTTPPVLIAPIGNVAVVDANSTTFVWGFRDPNGARTQTKADLRYRVVGTDEWINVFGTTETPGSEGEWTLPPSLFQSGYQYEWSVRTYNSTSLLSGWADPATFWAVPLPGVNNPGPLVTDNGVSAGSLGCGHNRVFVYDRGGKVLRGEITPASLVRWDRRRDDISSALITVNGWGEDCGDLLKTLRSWMHEIVIFRDGVRVWEGPITRIEYTTGNVTIEAKDVMAYLYRRIMRQGYNDSYQINGTDALGYFYETFTPLGLRTVTARASLITMNCLAYDDPNVLPYLTIIANDDDTVQSRVVPDYSKTAWEEIDDLAATGGLDYTTAGRRIIYWDTHRQLGLLPEMRDGDFSDPPVVTEYGMQTATDFAVTNNNGVYGVATRPQGRAYYGFIEQLASAYGETQGSTASALTAAKRAELEATLSSQAERNIGGRYPTPLVVRVPDNTTLNPELNISINQLIPGVWIPLRAVGTLRKMTQIQKLDTLSVEQDSKGERVKVVMSPAPGANQDFDADNAAVED